MRRALACLPVLLLACPSVEPEPGPEPTAEPEPAMINPFVDLEERTVAVRGIAEDFDFDCRTHEDEFDLSDEWDGEDSYVFIQNINSSTRELWESDVAEMFEWSPTNVHYFFVSAADHESDYASMTTRVEAALDAMNEEDEAHWRARVHIARHGRNDVGGLVEEVLETWPSSTATEGSIGWSWQGFAIDRFQRLREIGLTRVVAEPPRPNELWFIAHNPRYYNFEYDREVQLAAAPADLTVTLWDEEAVGGGGRDTIVEMPAAADLAAFDTLEIDLTMGCPEGGADRNCWEWDYKAHMRVCEAAVDPIPTDPCTPEATDEEGNILTPADTAPCPCNQPMGGTAERTRTCRAVSDEEGNVTGGEWGECACNCDGEIARWITTYHRHGRWVTDISPSLALMQGGGKQRFRFNTSYPYTMSAELRLSTRGDAPRPFAYVPLWGGGNFNSEYNERQEPIEFEAPPGTVRAEVVAWMTGHGFAGDAANCAEFCPHHHHFTVNGGERHTKAFDEAESWLGCIDQIDDGTVPNQFGTWYLGRGGWCPGMDVPPYRADVTADLTDGVNVIEYEASLFGNDPNNHGSIWMTSYLVFYRE